jgi:hypothetical protein
VSSQETVSSIKIVEVGLINRFDLVVLGQQQSWVDMVELQNKGRTNGHLAPTCNFVAEVSILKLW